MNDLNFLVRVLEASVKRKGEVPLTNAHLLNIVRMAIRTEERQQMALDEMLNEVLSDDAKWGSS